MTACNIVNKLELSRAIIANYIDLVAANFWTGKYDNKSSSYLKRGIDNMTEADTRDFYKSRQMARASVEKRAVYRKAIEVNFTLLINGNCND